MNNNRRQQLLPSGANGRGECSNFTTFLRCGTMQELSQLKWQNILLLVSVVSDLAHILLSVIFIIYWSSSCNYYHLIPFIPTLIIGCILVVGLARESLIRCYVQGTLGCLAKWFFVYTLILVFTLALSLCCPNTVFAMITSGPLMELSGKKNNRNPPFQAAFLRRQEIYLKYIGTVLQYVTGGVSFKDNVHRIVAANYFLQSVFHEALPGAKKEQNAIYLDRIRHLHQDIKPNPEANKLIDADVYWSEMADVVTSSKGRMFVIHVGAMLYIASFIQTVIIYSWTESGELGVGVTGAFVAYVVLQLAWCRLYWLFYTFALYLKRILPIFNWNTVTLTALKWNQKFGSREHMMTCIRAVHEILYEVHRNEIKGIYECVGQYDIAGLIAQYVWIELPVYGDIVDGIECYVEYKQHLDLPKGVEVLIDDGIDENE
eukprot:102744_1